MRCRLRRLIVDRLDAFFGVVLPAVDGPARRVGFHELGNTGSQQRTLRSLANGRLLSGAPSLTRGWAKFFVHSGTIDRGRGLLIGSDTSRSDPNIPEAPGAYRGFHLRSLTNSVLVGLLRTYSPCELAVESPHFAARQITPFRSPLALASASFHLDARKQGRARFPYALPLRLRVTAPQARGRFYVRSFRSPCGAFHIPSSSALGVPFSNRSRQ